MESNQIYDGCDQKNQPDIQHNRSQLAINVASHIQRLMLTVCVLQVFLLLLLLLFTQKQVFGPRTAKTQPIGIKFCTHLLLYGIHLWADLDRDRRMGGTRPKQNVCFSVILVTHHKSYIEMTDRRDFGGKPSEWRWGRVLSWKITEFCSMGGASSKKTAFLRFVGSLRLSCE